MSDSDSFDLAKLALAGDKVAQRLQDRIALEHIDSVIPSVKAEESAYKLLIQLAVYNRQPGIFLIQDGGFLFEWSSPKEVLSVEINQEGKFETYYLAYGQTDSIWKEGIESIDEVLDFIANLKLLSKNTDI